MPPAGPSTFAAVAPYAPVLPPRLTRPSSPRVFDLGRAQSSAQLAGQGKEIVAESGRGARERHRDSRSSSSPSNATQRRAALLSPRLVSSRLVSICLATTLRSNAVAPNHTRPRSIHERCHQPFSDQLSVRYVQCPLPWQREGHHASLCFGHQLCVPVVQRPILFRTSSRRLLC